MIGLDIATMSLIVSAIAGGWLAWRILQPKPDSIVLERVGEQYYLSKAYSNQYYLQYRKATYPIPSTYNYLVYLGKGFAKRPKPYRFFYIHHGQLVRVREGEKAVEAEPAIDPQTLTQFIRSQTITQILRGLTVSRTTMLLNLILGLAVGVMLGVILGNFIFHGGGGS